jgi:Lon protease-like protein
MATKFPARPNLEQLKKQAKDLVKACRNGDPGAYARIRAHLPSAHGEDVVASSVALHDAQSVIAREHGFPSWKELHAATTVEAISTENVRALMGPLPDDIASTIAEASARLAPFRGALPAVLPLVAVRDAMLTVGAVAPLRIERPSSLAAIEAAQEGDGLLGLFAQNDADLHPVGCIAQIVTAKPAPDGPHWLLVKAIRWVRVDRVEQRDAYQAVRISEIRMSEEPSEETERLHRALRERVDVLVADLPDAEQMRRMTAKMSALELADATVVNLPCAVEEKARYAAEPDLERRLRFVLGLIAPNE